MPRSNPSLSRPRTASGQEAAAAGPVPQPAARAPKPAPSKPAARAPKPAPSKPAAARPSLSIGLLVRATRAPFLTATLVPVVLGIAVAARAGFFEPLTAAITVVAACLVQIGLNVANDIFDTIQGADGANPTPTMFSGGSRVLQDGLMNMRGMALLSAGSYLAAAALGLVLLALRPSVELVVIAAVGAFISLAYTMPPLKFAYRGVGEIATAIGFGPVMLLGAYVVQSRGVVSFEAFAASIPVALLVAMILYVNEIPDRVGDAIASKRTLPVRWSRGLVVRVWELSVAGALLWTVGAVAAGALPVPTLVVLLAVPLALQVRTGLIESYDSPYELMPSMGANIKLHLTVGLLLVVGYLAAMLAQGPLGVRPFLW
jgi:1,4-dihydroxy-2-naphthoate octaprenyltransferase